MNIRTSLVSFTALTCLLAASAQAAGLKLELAGRYESGIFDGAAAEIVAYHPASRTAFLVNGSNPSVDKIVLTADGDGLRLEMSGELVLAANESPTSAAVHGDLVAVAVHDPDLPGNPGKVLFFSAAGQRLREVAVGFLPDMVAFTPDGRYVLTADEGEPTKQLDPEGSVTIIDLKDGVDKAVVRIADFREFDAAAMKAKGVRVFPGKTFAVDVEPEYVAVSPDSKTAWVTLQEANAIATVDIASAKITAILALGAKDHSKPENALDLNEEDGVNIRPYPVYGIYMPDTIASVTHQGKTYLITANEGDARDEELKFKDAKIAPNALSDSDRKAMSKIRLSGIDGDSNGDGLIDRIHTYGARSFSVWSTGGKQVYDSGSDFERITAEALGKNFNASNDKPGGDNRSGKKGPEPEGIAVGKVGDRTYVFIGLERVGGIMVYDVSDPNKPQFAAYQVDRDFSTTLDYERAADFAKAGDLGPEGLAFITAEDSPLGTPLLLVANEVSGTLSIYRVDVAQ